ncbi:aldehyde dehydrogenase family protein [Microbacterium sp. NPDC055357]
MALLPLVGGELTAIGEQSLPVVNPATGEILGNVYDVGTEGVDRAVRAAVDAQESWGALSPRDRARYLLRLADVIEQHAPDIAAIESLDVGKPYPLVPYEVESSVDKYRFFAGASRVLTGLAANEYRQPYTSFVRRDPVGVVAALAPWNYPFSLASWKIAPALAAGNTVVLKPSPDTNMSTLKLAELAAGVFPPGVLNIVTGGAEVGKALTAHPAVNMVSLTGGTATGKAVMQAAASSVKRLHLELGGNAAMLVFDDADLDRLRDLYFMAAFRNSGQDCHAASRVYAAEHIADEVAAVLSGVANTTRVGDPFDEAVRMGPLVSGAQHARVSGMLDRAVRQGAEIVSSSPAPTSNGFYLPPTVLRGVEHSEELVQEEIFGPLVTVGTFRDEDEAVRLANGVSQGLAASVWTGNMDRAMRVTKRLSVGTVWVNSHGATIGEMPFGGVKESGFGNDLSIYSMEQHTVLKHVAIYVDGH